jgi:hypothetical protein
VTTSIPDQPLLDRVESLQQGLETNTLGARVPLVDELVAAYTALAAKSAEDLAAAQAVIDEAAGILPFPANDAYGHSLRKVAAVLAKTPLDSLTKRIAIERAEQKDFDMQIASDVLGHFRAHLNPDQPDSMQHLANSNRAFGAHTVLEHIKAGARPVYWSPDVPTEQEDRTDL